MNIQEISACCPVIPVLSIDQLEHAVPLAQALCNGGLRVLEVTLRTEVALDAVRAIVREVPEAIVGVGTVVWPRQFTQAQEAGACFAVSPGFTPELGAAAADHAMPYLPGVFTLSDVISAMDDGHQVLKLFPARQAGGAEMLKTMAGLFPQLQFCPSGGVTATSAPELLALPNVACVCGSWLTPKALLQAGDWLGIQQLALDACVLADESQACLV